MVRAVGHNQRARAGAGWQQGDLGTECLHLGASGESSLECLQLAASGESSLRGPPVAEWAIGARSARACEIDFLKGDWTWTKQARGVACLHADLFRILGGSDSFCRGPGSENLRPPPSPLIFFSAFG